MKTECLWNADTYKSSIAEVERFATPSLALLEHAYGKELLDLGCGDGRLTQVLVNRGYHVTAVDASAEMVEACRRHGIPALQMDARDMPFSARFDVVYSHAVLHWITPPEDAVAAIARALKPDGLFIAQFGGKGDAAIIRGAIAEVMRRRGYDVGGLDPWYNPAPEEYNAILSRYGFKEIVPTHLIPVEYALPNGMYGYVETFFSNSLLSPAPVAEHREIIEESLAIMKPHLCDNSGNWHTDFRRITVCARKSAQQ